MVFNNVVILMSCSHWEPASSLCQNTYYWFDWVNNKTHCLDDISRCLNLNFSTRPPKLYRLKRNINKIIHRPHLAYYETEITTDFNLCIQGKKTSQTRKFDSKAHTNIESKWTLHRKRRGQWCLVLVVVSFS